MRNVLAVFLLGLVLLLGTPAIISCQSGGGFTGAQHSGNPNVRVWVNTASNVYHCQGTRWYGATKAGEYMTQKQAQAAGNRPAYGKYCE
ncbi:MAG: hypothetical protein AABM67_16410 [Acidobacteriota bacterium]